LKDISQELLESANSIKDITPAQISCLEAFAESTDFVAWIREEVPSKALNT